MKLNQLVLAGAIGATFIRPAPAAADFDSLEIESLGEVRTFFGTATLLRLYASGGIAGVDTLLSVGSADIATVGGTTFYQDPFGSDFAPKACFIPTFPSVAYDTFVTFNRLISLDDTTNGDREFSMSKSTISGGWFWVPGNEQGVADASGRVLIAQLTLNEYELDQGVAGSVTLFSEGGDPDGVEASFSMVNVTAPAALSLLLIAGVAVRRRRT